MIKGRLQTASATTAAGTSLAPAFTRPTQKGSLILVVETDGLGTSNSISSITDTQSNVYTRIASNSDAVSSNLDVWYTYNIPGGANTVTVNFASSKATVLIAEYSGVQADINPLNRSTSATGTSSPDSSGSTATTTTNNEIVIGFIGSNAALWTSYAAGTGYSNALTVANGGTRPALAIEDKLIDTVGTQAATFVVAGATSGVTTAVATFNLSSPSFMSQHIRPHLFSPGIAR